MILVVKVVTKRNFVEKRLFLNCLDSMTKIKVCQSNNKNRITRTTRYFVSDFDFFAMIATLITHKNAIEIVSRFFFLTSILESFLRSIIYVKVYKSAQFTIIVVQNVTYNYTYITHCQRQNKVIIRLLPESNVYLLKNFKMHIWSKLGNLITW